MRSFMGQAQVLTEMESKNRLSFDGVGPGSSALRRLTRSPSQRLNLRRSSSESGRSSSITSLTSDDSEIHQSACVSRDTARHECALHRFIVWVAVKRNACERMTPEEKRECPLLRCRKRFPNHELMLQHLYDCDQLALGEYWCYDCGRVERFSDAKCKRCLGHPSRRRRIISMARNFFSSLGHRSRNASLVELELDIDEIPPPSYDSILPPPQAELHSNEIHEIDSLEVPLPTIMEDTEEPEAAPSRAPTTVQVRSSPSHPVELESAPIFTDSIIDWPPSPPTINPTNLLNPEHIKGPERPVLQVHTMGLERYAKAKRRSNMLAPSSSVRSTASTASTNSTSSTASYNISPMSNWSGAWGRAPGFDSTLTSPADDLVSPGGLLPTNTCASSCKAATAEDDVLGKDSSDPFLSELPADIPMIDVLSISEPHHDTLGLDQTLLSLDTTVPTELSLDSGLAMTENSNMSLNLPLNPEPAVPSYTDPQSLVHTAWEALRAHVNESMNKLQAVSRNHLVNQIRNMSTTSIAREGLATLVELLEERQPTSPVKLLCFVHLIYALSLVMHEEDAIRRCTDLFCQAMSYGSIFSRQDGRAYMRVVEALWKPEGMMQTDVVELLRAKMASSRPGSASAKGKEPATSATQTFSHDSLVFVAQCFLDELEYSALQVVDQPEIQSSELSMQHLQDANMNANTHSPFAVTVNYVCEGLQKRYCDAPEFCSSLDALSTRAASNFVSTVRRLEVELMHAGRTLLPADTFFDQYILQIRLSVNQLYGQNDPQPISRLAYYRHGVRLMDAIMSRCEHQPLSRPEGPLLGETALESVDDFINSMTTGMEEFDIGAVINFDADPSLNFPTPTPDMTIDPYTLGESPQLFVTPEGSSSAGGPSTAVTSPMPPPTTVSSNKVESNSCCEICGYRPKGDPRWFGGSMAKHKKLQHSTAPPIMYRCPFPGCTSQYKNRPDNLRQHQIEKGHFMEGQEESGRRPSKRKKTEK